MSSIIVAIDFLSVSMQVVKSYIQQRSWLHQLTNSYVLTYIAGAATTKSQNLKMANSLHFQHSEEVTYT